MTGRALLMLAVLLGAASAGFWAYRLGAPDGMSPGSGAAGPPVADPLSDPAAAALPAARAVPASLPDITLADRDGEPRRLSDWKDRPLVVNFWATWCAPCRREIPLLIALRNERQSHGVEVIGIAVDFREDVLEYSREVGLEYPLLIGETDGLAAVEAFGMDMLLPFTVFADRRHRIVALKIGELHREEADFILDRVREIDAGRLELEAAKSQVATRLRKLAAERARKRAQR